MKLLAILSCVVLGLLFGQISQSAEEQVITIDLKNTDVNGHWDVDLKKAAMAQVPSMDPKTMQLNSVELFAKGKFGAVATLTIGSVRGSAQPIPVGDYADLSEQSFAHLEFLSAIDNFSATWFLTIHGSAKLNKLVLHVSNAAAARGYVEEEDLDQNYPYPRSPSPRYPDNRYPDRDRDRYGRQLSVYCASSGYRPNVCYIGDLRGRRVAHAYVSRQMSFASCYQNRDWWLDHRRNSIIVRNGCRAQFTVVLTGGWGR